MSPVVEGSGVVRVPGVASLRRCVAAGCDLPGYDVAWLFRGRCYVLSCQQREDCRPQERPGADSVLVFLRRGPSPSLRRGSSYGSRWRPLLPSSEHGGDLQGLPLLDGPRAALPLLDGPRDLGPLDPTVLDVEYPEESQDQDGIGPETSPLPTRDGFNQSESGSHPTQTRAGRIRTEDRTGTEAAGIRVSLVGLQMLHGAEQMNVIQPGSTGTEWIQTGFLESGLHDRTGPDRTSTNTSALFPDISDHRGDGRTVSASPLLLTDRTGRYQTCRTCD